MNLDRAIAAASQFLALCFLPAAATAQARAPSAIATVRPVPAAAASAAPNLNPDTVLAYTQQQLARLDREAQQLKQQLQLASRDGTLQKGQGTQAGKDAELNMLKLQSNISQRSNLVQITNNIIKSQATAASAARNSGH